ncbi:MAG TPA: sugar transferase [Kribbellaceae bacterium]|nr:sugar transferase [Kribbellaceae bacterium]
MHGNQILGGGLGGGGLVVAAVYFAVALLGRAVFFDLIRRLRLNGRLSQPALIVGATRIGTELAWRLQNHPESGLVPVGYVDDESLAASDRLPAPILGDVADLPKLVATRRIRHVFVASCRVRDADLVDDLRSCDRLDCEVYVVPRLFELGTMDSRREEHLGHLPLQRLHRAPYRSGTWPLKRMLDIGVGAVALALALPVMLVITVLLRREVPKGGVLFRQERVGLDGRRFTLIKFRTLKPVQPGTGASWSSTGVERTGPVGQFLRRSSLDELPQLWNVLCGDMSLVGPRPERPHYVQQFARRHGRYSARHRVPAGMTGLAQINGLRGDGSIVDRVRLDNYYIEHWSFWQDIKILIRTVPAVLRMRGR